MNQDNNVAYRSLFLLCAIFIVQKGENMANLLKVYCGSCHKPVAVVDRDDSMKEIFGSIKKCPKCDKPCIQNGQIILRDHVLDEISVVKVVSKPVVKTVIEPPIALKTTIKPPFPDAGAGIRRRRGKK